VAVVEVEPVRALEALMDGYLVMPADDASAWGELFITATGNVHIFRREHFEQMHDGAILANSGHFDAELELGALKEMSQGRCRQVRPEVQEYDLGTKKLYVLSEGRLVNLAAAEGHPAAVMDMSFANQALGLEWLRANVANLEPKVYGIPDAIDREVARLKLLSMGIRIDPMTAAQKAYSESWESGT